MSPKLKFHLRFSVNVLIFACALGWFIAGESSPLYEYFLWHVGIKNFWGMLNFPSFLASVLIGGHSGNDFVFYAAFAFQWFIIGLALSSIVLAFRNKFSKRNRSFG